VTPASWPEGTWTGVGSLPGTDPLAAATFVVENSPPLPHLFELPARGPGADAVGRCVALLVDIAAEVVPEGWALTARPGADTRRARAWLDADLAALAVAAHGYQGPVKVQVLGPLTLAASLAQARGEVAVGDRGLRADLSASLAEGVRGHLQDLQARLPGTQAVLQVDEPLAPSVLAGRLRTRSGRGGVPPVEAAEATALLAQVLAVVDDRARRVVHCCAADVPLSLVTGAGAGVVSFDLDLLGADLDPWGAAVDEGLVLAAGAVPTSAPTTAREAADRLLDLWSRLGFPAAVRGAQTWVTPTCGLAAVPLAAAASAYRTARDAAAIIAETD
jgi:methionine synthase II (cobalamin-independent)